MHVKTEHGVELWYDGEDSQAEFWVRDYLKFEKKFRRREKTLPVYFTVLMTLATMFSVFVWYISESWAAGLFVFGLLWFTILQIFAAAQRGMRKRNPNVVLMELLRHGIVDAKNDHGFVLLNRVLTERNALHNSLDDYDPKLVSAVVPGYLKAVAAVGPIHHWWPEGFPNTYLIAHEAADRLLGKAG